MRAVVRIHQRAPQIRTLMHKIHQYPRYVNHNIKRMVEYLYQFDITPNMIDSLIDAIKKDAITDNYYSLLKRISYKNKSVEIIAHGFYTGENWGKHIKGIGEIGQNQMIDSLVFLSYMLESHYELRKCYEKIHSKRETEIDLKKRVVQEVLSTFKPVQDKAKEINELMIKVNKTIKKQLESQ